MVLSKQGFLTSAGTPSRSGQVKEFFDTLLLPREMAIVKIKAHVNRVKGNPLADHFAKQGDLIELMILTKTPKDILWIESMRPSLNTHIKPLIWKWKKGKM